MSTDHLRHAATLRAAEAMRAMSTNTIAASVAWRIVNAALDGYEDQMAIDIGAWPQPAWSIMLDGKPIAVVPTRKIARQQRKLLATLAQRPVRQYTIVLTEVFGVGALSPAA